MAAVFSLSSLCPFQCIGFILSIGAATTLTMPPTFHMNGTHGQPLLSPVQQEQGDDQSWTTLFFNITATLFAFGSLLVAVLHLLRERKSPSGANANIEVRHLEKQVWEPCLRMKSASHITLNRSYKLWIRDKVLRRALRSFSCRGRQRLERRLSRSHTLRKASGTCCLSKV